MAEDDDNKLAPVNIFLPAHRSYTEVKQVIADMTPEAATAYKEMADKQFAAPAREKTKQVGIETVGRVALGGGLAAIACATIKDPTTLAIVLVAIAGIFGGKSLIEAFKKKSD